MSNDFKFFAGYIAITSVFIIIGLGVFIYAMNQLLIKMGM